MQHGQRLKYTHLGANYSYGMHRALWLCDPAWTFYWPTTLVNGCAWVWKNDTCPQITYVAQTAKPTGENWRFRLGVELWNRIYVPDFSTVASWLPYNGISDITEAYPKLVFFIFEHIFDTEDFDEAHEFINKRTGLTVNYLTQYRSVAWSNIWTEVEDIDEVAAVYPRTEDSTVRVNIKHEDACDRILLPRADNCDLDLIAVRIRLDDVRYGISTISAAHNGWQVTDIRLNDEGYHRIDLFDGDETTVTLSPNENTIVGVTLYQVVATGDIYAYYLYPEWYTATLVETFPCRQYRFNADDGRLEGDCGLVPFHLTVSQEYVKKLYEGVADFDEVVIEEIGWHIVFATMFVGIMVHVNRGFAESTDCKPNNLELPNYHGTQALDIDDIDGRWLTVIDPDAWVSCRKGRRDANYEGGRVYITGIELHECGLGHAELYGNLYLEAVSGSFNSGYSELLNGNLYLEGVGHHPNVAYVSIDNVSRDALTNTWWRLHLHTGDPGVDGTENEYSGGGYASHIVNWATADEDGWRYLVNNAAFKGTDTDNVSHVALWGRVNYTWVFLGSAALVGSTSFDSAGILVLTKDTRFRFEEEE